MAHVRLANDPRPLVCDARDLARLSRYEWRVVRGPSGERVEARHRPYVSPAGRIVRGASASPARMLLGLPLCVRAHFKDGDIFNCRRRNIERVVPLYECRELLQRAQTAVREMR